MFAVSELTGTTKVVIAAPTLEIRVTSAASLARMGRSPASVGSETMLEQFSARSRVSDLHRSRWCWWMGERRPTKISAAIRRARRSVCELQGNVFRRPSEMLNEGEQISFAAARRH